MPYLHKDMKSNALPFWGNLSILNAFMDVCTPIFPTYMTSSKVTLSINIGSNKISLQLNFFHWFFPILQLKFLSLKQLSSFHPTNASLCRLHYIYESYLKLVLFVSMPHGDFISYAILYHLHSYWGI